MKSSQGVQFAAIEAGLARREALRVAPSHTRLIDARLVRAELVRLRGPHAASGAHTSRRARPALPERV
ncbi:MAG: hypothetical protein H0X28_11805 [Solirubrobacterales bacterium]|nr:hypothetical protein [Solirubrobacterales bacterium]